MHHLQREKKPGILLLCALLALGFDCTSDPAGPESPKMDAPPRGSAVLRLHNRDTPGIVRVRVVDCASPTWGNLVSNDVLRNHPFEVGTFFDVVVEPGCYDVRLDYFLFISFHAEKRGINIRSGETVHLTMSASGILEGVP